MRRVLLGRALGVVAGVVSLATMGCASSSVAPAASPSASVDEARDKVLIHVVTRDAALEVANGDGWSRLCAAPCNDDFLLDARYRLVTADRKYPPFVIDAKPNARVDLEAQPGTGPLAGTGVAFIVVGGLAIPGGFVGWVAENVNHRADVGKSDVPGDNASHTTYGGLAVMIVGAVGLVAGLAMVSSSRPDEVVQSVRRRAHEKAASPDRAATWRTRDEFDRRAPRVKSAPLFSVSF